jgi:hyperosmotically inducible protein
MKPTLVALALLAAAAGCSGNGEKTAPQPAEPGAEQPSAMVKPADNTGRNERDSHGDTKTPGDQAENATDLAITQQIRQQVVKADDLSVNGKNVKIMTVDGVVTLRGPVATAREKTEIASTAKNVDGVKRVDNQLEIAAK